MAGLEGLPFIGSMYVHSLFHYLGLSGEPVTCKCLSISASVDGWVVGSK